MTAHAPRAAAPAHEAAVDTDAARAQQRKRRKRLATFDAAEEAAELGTAVALPYRSTLEAGFGLPLGDVRVRTGPDAAEWLDDLGAEAASVGDVVVLPSRDTPLAVVAHEVAHVLQRRAHGASPAGLEPADTPAEREASAFDPYAPPSSGFAAACAGFQAAEAPRETALFRAVGLPWMRPRSVPEAGSPERPEPSAESERSELQARLGGAAEAAPQAESAAEAEETAPEAITAEAEKAADEEVARAEAEAEARAAEAEAETAPAGEAEEAVPETEVDTAVAATAATPAIAERGDQEESPAPPAEPVSATFTPAASAEAALSQLTTATPSVQAALFPQVGAAATDGAATETSTFGETLEPLSAEIDGQATRLAAVPTDAMKAETTPVTAPELPAVPTVDVAAPTVEAKGTTSTLPAAATGTSTEATAAEKAARAQEALGDGATLDVATTAGARPAVPREGAANPAAVADTKQAGAEDGQAALTEAKAAVDAGPGPEAVQALAHSAEAEVPELTAPQLEGPPDVVGMAQLRTIPLPADLQGEFDARMAETTAAKAEAAQADVEGAAKERDEDRTKATNDANTELERVRKEQTTLQDQEVAKQRKSAETAVSDTKKKQDAELMSVQGQLDTQAEADRDKIEQRFTDDEAQIEKDYKDAESKAEDARKAKQAEADQKHADAEKKTGDENWWDSAVNAVSDFLDSFLEAIQALADALKTLVNGFFDAAAKLAKKAIDAAVSFAKDALAAYGEFAAGLINGLLGDIFPGLAEALTKLINAAVVLAQAAMDAIGEALKKGIDAAAEALKSAFNAIVDAYLSYVTTVVGLYQSALAGDWDAVIRVLLEAALSLAGIAPEAFYQFVGYAQETWTLIVNDPLTFVLNLAKSVIRGFQQFGDDVVNHLIAGFLTWVLGPFPVPLVPPATWDWWGILDVARQVLGLTAAHFENLARRVLGDTAVDAIKALVDAVMTIVNEGWGAFFEQIKTQITGLAEEVMTSLVTGIASKVAQAAIPWLIALCDVSGITGVVKILQSAWGIYTAIRDNFQHLYGVVESVVTGIGQIARAELGPAADKVESTLGSLIAPLLDLLAKAVPVDFVSPIREAVDTARTWIDKGIIWLLTKLKDTVLGALGLGGEKKKEDGKFDGEIGETLTFTAGGEGHKLWIDPSSGVMIQSTRMTVADRIANWEKRIGEDPDPTPDKGGPTDRKSAESLLPLARGHLAAVDRERVDLAKATRPEEKAARDKAIEDAEARLRAPLAQLFDLYLDKKPGLPADWQAGIDAAAPAAQRGRCTGRRCRRSSNP